MKQEDSGEADYRRHIVRGDWTPPGQLVMPWVGVKGEAVQRESVPFGLNVKRRLVGTR